MLGLFANEKRRHFFLERLKKFLFTNDADYIIIKGNYLLAILSKMIIETTDIRYKYQKRR